MIKRFYLFKHLAKIIMDNRKTLRRPLLFHPQEKNLHIEPVIGIEKIITWDDFLYFIVNYCFSKHATSYIP